MTRTSNILLRCRASFLLAAAISCSPDDAGDTLSRVGGGRQPVAVVTVTSDGGRNCSIRWEGQAVSEEELLKKSVAQIERRIEEVGGIEGMTEQTMPYVRVEAAGATPYSCVGPAMFTLQRAGFTNLVVKPAGTAAPDHNMEFLAGSSSVRNPPSTVLRIQAGDRMTWNGEPVELARLSERIKARYSTSPSAYDFVVAPDEDARFAALYEAVRVIREQMIEPTLSGCTGTSGPREVPAPC